VTPCRTHASPARKSSTTSVQPQTLPHDPAGPPPSSSTIDKRDSAQNWPVSSGGGEPHLRQHRAAEQAKRIGQRLQHLKVVVALADKELDGLAGGFDRRVEVARLALELRRLAGAVSENEWRVELVEVA